MRRDGVLAALKDAKHEDYFAWATGRRPSALEA